MTWAEPRWLAALLLLPVLLGGLFAAAAVHRQRLLGVFSATLLARVLPPNVRARRAVRDTLLVLGLAGIVLALAEPRFDKVVRKLEVKGSDVVLLLDLSRSMDAQDVDPSRLERARREIADLGALIGGDRIGLVVFAGGAYPRLPLTADFRAVQLVVNEAETSDFDTQGSDLGAAIRAALELLDRSQERAGQALLVLSDGEVHDRDDALAAASQAGEHHVPIFVMGIGNQAAPIPTAEGRNLQYKGETVQTVPDFEVLEEVARRTGGAFVVSNATSKDMGDLYAEIQRSVVAVQRSVQQRETYNSEFQYPLGLGALFLFVAAWLGDGRRAFGAAAVGLLALALAAEPASAADPLAESDQLFRAQKYEQAAEKLVELSLERPDDPEVFERLGAARYRAGDYEGAGRAFERSADLEEDPAQALYNAGNAHYMSGRLEDAQSRYEEALEHAPAFQPAAQNRDLVQKEIAARRAAKPPPPPQSGQGQPPPQPQPEPQQPPPPDQGQPPPQGGEGKPNQGDPDQQQPPGQPPPAGADQEQEQDDPSAEPVDPDEVKADGDPNQPAPGSGDGAEDSGPITASQAERLLDSVEEGSRRTVVQGTAEGKPW